MVYLSPSADRPDRLTVKEAFMPAGDFQQDLLSAVSAAAEGRIRWQELERVLRSWGGSSKSLGELLATARVANTDNPKTAPPEERLRSYSTAPPLPPAGDS
jgi:hypothetical protein